MITFALLVDDINETKTFGIAKSLNKVEFNSQTLGLSFEIGINTAFSKAGGITGIGSAG